MGNKLIEFDFEVSGRTAQELEDAVVEGEGGRKVPPIPQAYRGGHDGTGEQGS